MAMFHHFYQHGMEIIACNNHFVFLSNRMVLRRNQRKKNAEFGEKQHTASSVKIKIRGENTADECR